MPRYGRGLNREIVSAVNEGIIREPFSVADVKAFTQSRGWDVPDTYLNVCLANAASDQHSATYKKYFLSLGNGKYEVKQEYKRKHN